MKYIYYLFEYNWDDNNVIGDIFYKTKKEALNAKKEYINKTYTKSSRTERSYNIEIRKLKSNGK